jgi:predicted glycosyltransferase
MTCQMGSPHCRQISTGLIFRNISPAGDAPALPQSVQRPTPGSQRKMEVERLKAAVEETKLGGQRGRALYIHMVLAAKETNPDLAKYIVEAIVPSMPTDDREICLFVLEEIQHAKVAKF